MESSYNPGSQQTRFGEKRPLTSLRDSMNSLDGSIGAGGRGGAGGAMMMGSTGGSRHDSFDRMQTPDLSNADTMSQRTADTPVGDFQDAFAPADLEFTTSSLMAAIEANAKEFASRLYRPAQTSALAQENITL